MKRCFRCGEMKELSEFYRHPAMPDGHLGKCRECTRKDNRANRAKNVEYYRQYDRERGKTPVRKALYASKSKAKRASDPMYQAAWNAVTRAIKAGKLTRPTRCNRCSKQCKPHAHHDDHARPLDVLWLCPVCHAARHKELACR